MKHLGRAILAAGAAVFLLVSSNAGCHGRGALGGTPYYGPGSAPVPPPASLSANNRVKHLYVANSGTNDIFIAAMDTASGAIFPINTNNVPTGSVPLAILGNPAAPIMCTINVSSSDIWLFKVDNNTGNLTRFGSPTPLTGQPTAAAWSFNGKFLYVYEQSANGPQLVTYNFDTTLFTLTTTNNTTTIGNAQGGGTNPYTGQPNPASVPGIACGFALSPGGKFAYCGTTQPDQIAVVILNNDGSTQVQGSLQPAGPTQSSIAPYPGGRFVYASNAGSGDVGMFAIDPNNNLLPVGGPIQTGQAPNDIFINVAGTDAWVVNEQSGDIACFSIQGPTGTLSLSQLVGSTPQATIGNPPQAWPTAANQPPPFPDGIVTLDTAQLPASLNPCGMVVTDDQAFAYVLNLGGTFPGAPPTIVPAFVAIYQIATGGPTANPPGGVLVPVLLPTQAVPTAANPVTCSGNMGIPDLLGGSGTNPVSFQNHAIEIY